MWLSPNVPCIYICVYIYIFVICIYMCIYIYHTVYDWKSMYTECPIMYGMPVQIKLILHIHFDMLCTVHTYIHCVTSWNSPMVCLKRYLFVSCHSAWARLSSSLGFRTPRSWGHLMASEQMGRKVVLVGMVWGVTYFNVLFTILPCCDCFVGCFLSLF